jgi:hypothetical protein
VTERGSWRSRPALPVACIELEYHEAESYRLILELEQDEQGNLLVIVNIEDYH